MQHLYDSNVWINENFSDLDLGDKRRSKRAQQIALKFLEDPHKSIPQQMSSWSEIKAAYRFLSNSKVTHKKIQAPHNKKIRETSCKENLVLFSQDTSELEFTCQEEMGPLGHHKGMLFHSCLAITVSEEVPQVLGLASQKAWVREDLSRKKTETRTERNKRKKESSVWMDTLKSIGRPPPMSKWVSIGDRANDIFEFMHQAKKLDWEFVIRASQNRVIEGEEYSLTKIRSLQSCAKTKVEMRKRGETVNREIELKLSFSEFMIQPPTRYKKKEACKVWVIRCWNEEEDIEWILYSSLPVENPTDAIERCFWYSCRWIIEEYHKCLKTGCKIEERQLKTAHGLKTILGIFSIIAVKLLQLKSAARSAKNTHAKEEVPEVLVKIVCKKYRIDENQLTLKEFWRRVAMYGGFIGRKSDGDPGWQTLWKGWLELITIWEGFEMAINMMKTDLVIKNKL